MGEAGTFLFQNLWAAGLSFLALALVFAPLEWLVPAKPGQRFFRPEWFTDLAFFLGQYLIWSGLIVALLRLLSESCHGILFGSAVSQFPLYVQVLLAVALGDFCIYWVHRLQHTWDFLWRFHSVHHTAEHLDWLAAHREHPVDGLVTQAVINLPAFLLGVPLSTISWLIIFRGIWAIYIHSNVRFPLGPLRVLIGAPEIHHWHHSKERKPGNFANLSPLMDVIFGTYVCKDHEPAAFGVAEASPRSYTGQLVHAFTRPTKR